MLQSRCCHRVRPGAWPLRSVATQASTVICTVSAAQAHSKAGHPECPERVEAIAEALDATGAITVVRDGGGRRASEHELGLVHPPGYLSAVLATCNKLKESALVDDSTYLAPGSYDACAQSVGAALSMLDGLLDEGHGAAGAFSGSGAGGGGGGGVDASAEGRGHASGFALVRPPGHHVLPGRPMGFGVFNTIAIAVQYARQRYGIKKVLVVDFDVHHGNGTQEVFYEDPHVLYISVHQAGLWPYTGKARETGSGEGRGTTINVPLPGGSGDAALKQAFTRVIRPAAERFRPELVLSSAGFDAHWRDPLAGMQLTPQGYHWLCLQLRELSLRLAGPGRLGLVLEGGYDRPSLAESVVASLEGLAGLPYTSVPTPGARDLYEEPARRVEAAIQEVCRLHGL